MDCHRKAHTTIKWPMRGKTRILKSVQTYRGTTRSPRFHTSELGNDVGTRRSASVPSRRWTSSKFYGHLANHILHVFFFFFYLSSLRGKKLMRKKRHSIYQSTICIHSRKKLTYTLHQKKKIMLKREKEETSRSKGRWFSRLSDNLPRRHGRTYRTF